MFKIENITLEDILSGRVKVTSDHHFDHRNIVKYSKRPGYRENGNHDYYYHNVLMRKNWHEDVGEDDIVIHLGDVAMNENAIDKWVEGLPGKIVFIQGNHDKGKVAKALVEVGWNKVPCLKIILDQGEVLLTHYPVDVLNANQICLHGHIHLNTSPTPRHINCCVDYKGIDYRVWPLIDKINEGFSGKWEKPSPHLTARKIDYQIIDLRTK